MDNVSELVARQYTTYCYPEPIEDLRTRIGAGDFMYGDPSLFSAQL